ALDRSDAAADMDAQAERRGHRHPAIAVLLPFLNDAASSQPAPQVLQNGDVDQYRAQFYRAQLLDATGQMTAGFNLWLATANTAKITPALASTAAYALAQAALNRALTADCETAAALARESSSLPRGENAIYATGMARGLCGDAAGARTAVDALRAGYPQSFAVKNYYLAELTAVDQMHAGNTDAALVTLQAAKPFDLLSLIPYERGLAHASAKQWPLAIADFQFVLLHRGAATLIDAPMYPMAQLGYIGYIGASISVCIRWRNLVWRARMLRAATGAIARRRIVRFWRFGRRPTRAIRWSWKRKSICASSIGSGAVATLQSPLSLRQGM